MLLGLVPSATCLGDRQEETQAFSKILASHVFTKCKMETKHLAVLHARLDSLKCMFRTINRKHFVVAFVNKGSGSDVCLSFSFPSEAPLLHKMKCNLFTQKAGCDNDTNDKYGCRVSGRSGRVWTSLQIAWETLEREWISSSILGWFSSKVLCLVEFYQSSWVTSIIFGSFTNHRELFVSLKIKTEQCRTEVNFLSGLL